MDVEVGLNAMGKRKNLCPEVKTAQMGQFIT
jgi:hypothetical protein